jgi:hypothetical protein
VGEDGDRRPLWIVLPLAIGLVRLRRSEAKEQWHLGCERMPSSGSSLSRAIADQNLKFVGDTVDAWNRGDRSRWIESLDDDVVWFALPGNPDYPEPVSCSSSNGSSAPRSTGVRRACGLVAARGRRQVGWKGKASPGWGRNIPLCQVGSLR